MIRRRQFQVEISFDPERRWRTYVQRPDLLSALSVAQGIVATKPASGYGYIFPNVRITFRGVTLSRWKNGGLVR